MQHAGVQEDVGKRLPHEPMRYAIRNKSKIEKPEIPSGLVEKEPGKFLRKKNAAADDAQSFDGARKISADVETVAVAAGECAHSETSLKVFDEESKLRSAS